MDEEMRGRLKALEKRDQATLLWQLDTELDLAFTMLQTAHIETDLDPRAVPGIVQNIRAAVRRLRTFAGGIKDTTEWSRIHSRTDELESALDSLCARFEEPGR